MKDNSAFLLDKEPKYIDTQNEKEIFEAAWSNRVPLMLKGPTGSGKTRFIEHMAWKLKQPLITVSCHEDMTASDLVGRFLLEGTETVWKDGPLTRAVRYGGICYLDEIVEARQDTTVVIHSLTDDPGYQSVLKDLKESTKQRFAGIDFDYPSENIEKQIIILESGVSEDIAKKLIKVSERTRNLKGKGLHEGASTRMLIAAAKLYNSKISFIESCLKSIVLPITDDKDVRDSLERAIRDIG
jgi:nitric oxide reductase NorQ protein